MKKLVKFFRLDSWFLSFIDFFSFGDNCFQHSLEFKLIFSRNCSPLSRISCHFWNRIFLRWHCWSWKCCSTMLKPSVALTQFPLNLSIPNPFTALLKNQFNNSSLIIYLQIKNNSFIFLNYKWNGQSSGRVRKSFNSFRWACLNLKNYGKKYECSSRSHKTWMKIWTYELGRIIL